MTKIQICSTSTEDRFSVFSVLYGFEVTRDVGSEALTLGWVLRAWVLKRCLLL